MRKSIRRGYTSACSENNHLHIIMKVNAAMLLWTICYFLTQTRSIWSQQTATTDDPEDASPYLIFTTQFGVHRRALDGGETEDLVVGSHGYGPLDYHYQKDLLFWVNTAFHRIMEAKLSDGSSVRVLVDDLISDPADLTVDWINDKLYWIDASQCEIWEYDMETDTTRYVMSTGTADTNLPRAIVIYPYLHNGWLYWTDRLSGSVVMGTVHGGTMEIFIDDLSCVEALTIDYTTHILYWADICEYTFQSLSMNGNRETHTYPFNRIVFFVNSIAKFGDDLYWLEPNGIHAISQSGSNYRRVMVSGSSERPLGLQVVHPSHQPQEEEYMEIIMNATASSDYECDPLCIGTCIPPGLCACKKGWKGPVCDEDIDECAEGTSGCHHICTNYEGGFNCSCYSGYATNADLKTCSDIDECVEDTSGCQHICANYEGGFNCSCYSGYAMNADLKTCSDIDECGESTSGCHHICTNYEGGFNCSCYSGYAMNADLKTCHRSVSSPNVQYTITADPHTTTRIQPTVTSLPSALKSPQSSPHTSFLVSSTVQPVTSLFTSSLLSHRTLTTTRIISITPFFSSSILRRSTLTTTRIISGTPILTSSLLSRSSLTISSITAATSYTTSVVQSSIVWTTTTSIPTPMPYSSFKTFVTSLVLNVISSPAMIISSTPTSEIIIRTPIVSELIKSAITSTETPSTVVTSAMPQYTATLLSKMLSKAVSITPTSSESRTSSDVVSSNLVSMLSTKIRPSSTMVTTLLDSEGVLQSTTSKTMVIRTTSSTFSASLKVPLQSITLMTSTHQQTPTLDVSSSVLLKATNDLKWYDEYQAAIIITAVGILPPLLAITVLVVILVYCSRSQSGSWSPNNDIPEEPQIEDNNVTMASFRSLHGPE